MFARLSASLRLPSHLLDKLHQNLVRSFGIVPLLFGFRWFRTFHFSAGGSGTAIRANKGISMLR